MKSHAFSLGEDKYFHPTEVWSNRIKTRFGGQIEASFRFSGERKRVNTGGYGQNQFQSHEFVAYWPRPKKVVYCTSCSHFLLTKGTGLLSFVRYMPVSKDTSKKVSFKYSNVTFLLIPIMDRRQRYWHVSKKTWTPRMEAIISLSFGATFPLRKTITFDN